MSFLGCVFLKVLFRGFVVVICDDGVILNWLLVFYEVL